MLLLHNPDFEMYQGTDPLWQALGTARSQGKIRHYGASLDFAAEIEACLRNTRSEVLETLFNIFHHDVRRADLVSQLRWLTVDGDELSHKAIGFLLSYENVHCVIPGIRSETQLKANLCPAGHRVSLQDRKKLEAFWDETTKNRRQLLPW